jgi:hypothetical protein
MIIKSARAKEEVFLLRVWFEPDAGRQPHRRAQVTHVGSRKCLHFTEYGQLCEFVDRMLSEFD